MNSAEARQITTQPSVRDTDPSKKPPNLTSSPSTQLPIMHTNAVCAYLLLLLISYLVLYLHCPSLFHLYRDRDHALALWLGPEAHHL